MSGLILTVFGGPFSDTVLRDYVWTNSDSVWRDFIDAVRRDYIWPFMIEFGGTFLILVGGTISGQILIVFGGTISGLILMLFCGIISGLILIVLDLAIFHDI